VSSLATRLYRGEAGVNIVGRRKLWYSIAGAIVLIAILSFFTRGFSLGIEFEGGNILQIPQRGVSITQAENAVADAGADVVSAQRVGGAGGTYLIRTEPLSEERSAEIKTEVSKTLNIEADSISDNRVSAAWGSQITEKAMLGLLVFLCLVIIYLVIRFEWRMAVGAMAALASNLVLTAAVYSLVGFEVTPSTIIGLLTILGFALYDVVVVFDKVHENTAGILGGSRTTYSEAANLAVNQTLMRSINTAVIALLPVGGLLFIGAGLLGAGTLKDLGLVLFVGMGAGVLSSIFLATPVTVDLKEREPKYAALRQRVLARRASGGKEPERAATAPAPAKAADTTDTAEDRQVALASANRSAGSSSGSRPGGARQSSSASQRRRTGGKPGRPSGSKRKR
jgi:preprotein translocase subunit SecF